MKSILKSNVKLFYGIAVLSALVLSLSYGVFVIQSNQYSASELLVGNLLYGITVHDTDKQELSNPVTVSTGETTLYITIASVNSITSKYTLAYNNSNVSVSASNKSGWNASGSMSNFQDYAYTKTVKVVVTNNTGTNQTVTFAAFGGYSYNSAANIPLGNGYYTVANFTDVTQVSGELLTDIVEEDTNCSSSNCLYGGEATTNYFSFEENGDLYRIIGTYTLNNEKTTKIAANDLVQTTTPSNLNTTLSTIANTLETDYIYNTNLFNCQGTTSLTCTSYNNFNSNIGILSLDEYKQLEGDNENNYLYNSNSYYLLNNNTLVTNTNQTETPSSGYIRPTMYLTDETQVEGSGTVSDPYTIPKEDDSDFNLVAIMVEQTEGENDYTLANSLPANVVDYIYNDDNSYCTVNDVIDPNITISLNNGYLNFGRISTSGTKCYVYLNIKPISEYLKAIMKSASKGTISTFNAIAEGDTANSGVYQTNATDDGSTVYYYRGNVQNNWVRFGSKNGTCYYWRIIRTNTVAEGGGVRLLYAGSSTTCSGSVPVMTNAIIGSSYYATSSGRSYHSSYVGYMFDVGSQFGHGTSSYAKQQIDLWYESSGLSNFASSINENAIYCSDRTTATNLGTYGTWSATGTKFSYSAGYRAGYYYKSSGNLGTDTSVISPTLACTNSEDKFSKGTSAGGNGYLSNPIAMMTSDELMYAGARIYNTSYAYYYYASDTSSSATYDKGWWTMSPLNWNGDNAEVFVVSGHPESTGRMNNDYVSESFGLRPVVSLKSDVTITGSGTVSDPYEVEGTIPKTCTVTQTGSNGFSADYNCVGGTGTMTACKYNGTYGSATCNGGSGYAPTQMCTFSSSFDASLYDYCNRSLPDYRIYGGGLASSINCSCD